MRAGQAPAAVPVVAADASGAGPDTAALRHVFGQYPTGVAVVAVHGAAGMPVAMTINSFTTLSLQPPLVAWSIGELAADLPMFRDAAYFGISLLSSGQEAVARHFADPLRRRTPVDADVLDLGGDAPRVRNAVGQGESEAFCLECGEPIPEARRQALKGVKFCVNCQSKLDQQQHTASLYNRRGSKDSQLR